MRDMKNWLIVLLIIVVSLVISLRAGALNWINQLAICGMVYFVVGLIYGKKLGLSRLLYGAITVLPFLAIYTVFVLRHALVHVYPIAFLPLVTISAGLQINKWHSNGVIRPKIIAAISTGFVIILLLGYLGMPNWLAYAFSNKNHVKYPAPSIMLQRSDGSVFQLDDQRGKTLVLDFWNTGCGICFQKFPDFDKLKQKYAANPEIEFYAVNLIQRKQGLGQVKKVTDKFSYGFDNLYADSLASQQCRKLLYIEAVPAMIIINKNAEVVYKGNMNTEKYIFIDNINRAIASALNAE